MNRIDQKRVLVVDDDEGIAHLLKLHLEKAQYQVMLAENGAQAVRHMYETPVHVALVDLRLGEEDGITVMELLHKGQPTLPVIIMTAYATIETALAAGKKGAFDYISKPYDVAVLMDTVARAVKESHP